MAHKKLISSLILALLCISIENNCFFYIFYPIYKSFMIFDIIYLLKGNKIVFFREAKLSKIIKILIIIFIELFTTFIFLFIVFFIPSLDNFYLFFVRILIEHLTIMAIGIKMLLNNFLRLYETFRVEKRFRTILTLVYKCKLIIYIKVLIFAFLYSLGFIVMNIVIIGYHINYYCKGFFYIIYLNITLEFFYSIILAILFFPNKKNLYFFNISYNYHSFIFFTEIKSKKEKQIKIKNLTNKILEDQYIKKEYPLVLVGPFIKNNNLYNDDCIHLGIVKKN